MFLLLNIAEVVAIVFLLGEIILVCCYKGGSYLSYTKLLAVILDKNTNIEVAKNCLTAILSILTNNFPNLASKFKPKREACISFVQELLLVEDVSVIQTSIKKFHLPMAMRVSSEKNLFFILLRIISWVLSICTAICFGMAIYMSCFIY